MAAIRIIQVDTDEHIAQLRDLLDEYLQPMRDLPAEYGIELTTIPTFSNLDEELASLPGVFVPPHGRFFVALDDDRVVGCVALMPISATVCELKRMYVRPEYRGQRVGWRLVETLIETAREIGYTRLILDSHISMTKAHSIYRGLGFVDVPAPDDFPEFLKGQVIFMSFDLKRTPA